MSLLLTLNRFHIFYLPAVDTSKCTLWMQTSHLNKMQFLIVSRRKSQEFFPTAPFFFVVYMIAYQTALIPRKLLCTKEFLITHLGWLLLLISFALVNIYLYMEQKQLSSHTKIKKKCASVLHLVQFRTKTLLGIWCFRRLGAQFFRCLKSSGWGAF